MANIGSAIGGFAKGFTSGIQDYQDIYAKSYENQQRRDAMELDEAISSVPMPEFGPEGFDPAALSEYRNNRFQRVSEVAGVEAAMQDLNAFTNTLFQGYSQNLRTALASLQAGNADAAIGYLNQAYNFFPDGRKGVAQMTPEGLVMNVTTPDGQSFTQPVTRELILDAYMLAQDPAAFAKFDLDRTNIFARLDLAEQELAQRRASAGASAGRAAREDARAERAYQLQLERFELDRQKFIFDQAKEISDMMEIDPPNPSDLATASGGVNSVISDMRRAITDDMDIGTETQLTPYESLFVDPEQSVALGSLAATISTGALNAGGYVAPVDSVRAATGVLLGQGQIDTTESGDHFYNDGKGAPVYIPPAMAEVIRRAQTENTPESNPAQALPIE